MRKKILMVLLTGVMVLSFAACGSNGGSDAPVSGGTQEAPTDSSVAGEADPDTISLTVNTEGMGQVAQAKEGEEPIFDDEFPMQSLAVNATETTDYVLGAKADEGWKFVAWIKDGEEFSTDEQITVTVSENMEFVAVFEVE